MTTGTTVSRVEQHKQTMVDLFQRAQPTIEAMIPKHMSAERLLKIALIATTRTPLLMQCTPKSVLQAVVNAAQLGLECNSPLGHAYMVPFKNNKHNVYEATLIPGYRGYVDLAHRSGKVAGIFANPVFEGDEFEYEEGMNPKVYHKPSRDAGARDVKKLIACYAVAALISGFRQPKVMFREELDLYRARSRARNDGPWQSDPIQMYQKTPVRQIIKFLPLSPELGALSELDNRADTGEVEVGSDILDIDLETGLLMTPEPEPTGTERLRGRLEKKTGEKAEDPDAPGGQLDQQLAQDGPQRQPGED